LVQDLPVGHVNADFIANVRVGSGEVDRWIAVVDTLGRLPQSRLYQTTPTVFERLLAALLGDPSRTGVLHLVAAAFEYPHNVPRLRAIATALDLHLLRPQGYATPESVRDALVVWAAAGGATLKDVPEFVELATSASQAELYTPHVVARVLERFGDNTDFAERALVEMAHRMVSGSRMAADLVYAARQVYAKRRSDISGAGAELQLHL